jgi:hypothetical protein
VVERVATWKQFVARQGVEALADAASDMLRKKPISVSAPERIVAFAAPIRGVLTRDDRSEDTMTNRTMHVLVSALLVAIQACEEDGAAPGGAGGGAGSMTSGSGATAGASGGALDASNDGLDSGDAGARGADSGSDVNYPAACAAAAAEHAKLHPDAVCLDACVCESCAMDAVVCSTNPGCNAFVNCASAMGCFDPACAMAKCPDQFADAGTEGLAQATSFAICVASANCALRCAPDAWSCDASGDARSEAESGDAGDVDSEDDSR